MDAEWIKSPTARRILLHWADSRPAWLWSHDGSTLLWRNSAARYFNGRIKKSGLKLSPDAAPIKGQVSRLIRLGSIGRSSLSRVQFIAGEKPVATTCSCTPLPFGDNEAALLLVGVDPIASELMGEPGDLEADAVTEALLPDGMAYALVVDGQVRAGTATLIPEDAIRIPAGQQGTELVLFAAGENRPGAIEDVRRQEGENSAPAEGETDGDDVPEPMLPMGLPPVAAETPLPSPSEDWVEPPPPLSTDHALSSLFDRLAGDAELYTTLTERDEVFAGAAAAETALEATTSRGETSAGDVPGPDMIATLIEYADETEPTVVEDETKSHWLITGRGFRRIEADAPVEAETPAPQAPATPVDSTPDAELAERVTRYNFEELGRILTDRVSGDAPARIEPEPPIAPRPAAAEGVINLNAETLVLNRLPLAILVFRDQQVLFANRALTDLLGHDSVASLRAAGIAAIFPGEGETGAGPVDRLVRRDGTHLPVTARLQSVSWQGRAALMLSASPAEPIRGHEGAVRAFAEIAAEAREEGFLIADRAGVIVQASGPARALTERPGFEIVGKPLSALVGKADLDRLRTFLEKPARFAETARPSLVATSADGNADLVLFAEGQAGLVTGYFAFAKARLQPTRAKPGDDELEPSMLGRLSRGIRRPLNTIIGFADLLRTTSLGKVENERAVEYARDIRTAGLEIAVLVDELDDFTRLHDGRYAPRPSDVELGALLESCKVRVKGQAGAARVLVRSAISETLPRIRADRASLGQALLNLLASAIDQTPVGGSVILSAQVDDDGAIAIHVRDGANAESDLGERFVVFRDGVDKDGEQLAPVRSTVGLALTRSLLAVNACSLSVDPTAGVGTLFSLLIPADLVMRD